MLPVVVALLVAAVGCGSPAQTMDTAPTVDGAVETPDGPPADGGVIDSAPPDVSPALTGAFTLLTYNVAGLPFGLSQSDPDLNTPLISPLLNNHDLALLQEDFSYTAQLSSAANHAYISTPGGSNGSLLNDGLTRLSNLPFTGHQRHKWILCNGIMDAKNDCLAAKGYSVAETELAPGVTVDIYNLHLDAGKEPGDLTARQAQVGQLLEALALGSAGRPVIIAGDTNLKVQDLAESDALFSLLLQEGELSDACRSLGCGEEHIDRVLFRGSDTLELVATSWTVDDRFVDADGEPLSDHDGVAVQLSWSVLSP